MILITFVISSSNLSLIISTLFKMLHPVSLNKVKVNDIYFHSFFILFINYFFKQFFIFFNVYYSKCKKC